VPLKKVLCWIAIPSSYRVATFIYINLVSWHNLIFRMLWSYFLASMVCSLFIRTILPLWSVIVYPLIPSLKLNFDGLVLFVISIIYMMHLFQIIRLPLAFSLPNIFECDSFLLRCILLIHQMLSYFSIGLHIYFLGSKI